MLPRRLPLPRLALGCALGATLMAGSVQAEPSDLTALIEAAQQEGRVDSVGMPDSWANWKDTWQDLKTEYGLEHMDTDMSSAQEVAKFKAEGENATADIGDVGFAFGPIAVEQGVTQPYKPSTWEEIPDWAKDEDGHWMLGYTGTISFMINKELVPEDQRPGSFADLREGDYRVSTGAVGQASQANNALLAAAYANGGSEADLSPGYEMFAELARQGRLSLAEPSIANLEKGEIEVGLLWDFNALNYRDQIDRDAFEVVIPSDASVTSGYATIINRHAAHPNAAKLAREFILSDQGQLNLAEGYARPIRAEHLEMPDEIADKLLPNEQYANARPIQDFAAWEQSARELPRQWQSQVLIHQQ
ncbi:extracellular solute-binding protein [Halomonas eurihalina]|uniref:Extracellular solute-binding protein n=1 Tax=Halomonas eurihalina TaxID=42566 RepID=A0A5D9CM94_HALER|nr:extracellular solute-binding protein [Halomonas eurihalina]MDR5860476.1 extracellular solute-binding protein [Halomonas eurihalina]TZG32814.1 extracellular solute-binding protein [Halomonas eurihalina]